MLVVFGAVCVGICVCVCGGGALLCVGLVVWRPCCVTALCLLCACCVSVCVYVCCVISGLGFRVYKS